MNCNETRNLSQPWGMYNKVQTFHVVLTLLCLLVDGPVLAQPAYEEIGLTDKTAFANAGTNWRITSDVWFNLAGNRLEGNTGTTESPGTGTLVCEPSGSARSPLTTKMQHGNIAVEFD